MLNAIILCGAPILCCDICALFTDVRSNCVFLDSYSSSFVQLCSGCEEWPLSLYLNYISLCSISLSRQSTISLGLPRLCCISVHLCLGVDVAVYSLVNAGGSLYFLRHHKGKVWHTAGVILVFHLVGHKCS